MLSGAAGERVRLNIGGRRFETTQTTLTGDGKLQTFFSSLIRHAKPSQTKEEVFIDRDGDAFAPLLTFLRTGILHIPDSLSEAVVRTEADFYCIPLPPAEPVRPAGIVRHDGMYLSFAAGRVPDGGEGSSSCVATGDVRAYLQFGLHRNVVLGRREADGQWSTTRCRYSCLAGGLLLVHRTQHCKVGSDNEADVPTSGSDGEAQDPIELSAVVLDAAYIEVISCGRVGRLEKPFHFIASRTPTPGMAFVSQTAHNALNSSMAPGPGRVVLAFESDVSVGVMVTSSQPGWSAATASHYRAFCHRHAKAAGAPKTAPDETSRRVDSERESLVSTASPLTPSEDLWHIHIDNGNFTRTVDFVSLSDHALVEFVQLNAKHDPQPIWYRPVAKTVNPWSRPKPNARIH